jgi:predicted lipoprotein with Yx(FWY)xxD motif
MKGDPMKGDPMNGSQEQQLERSSPSRHRPRLVIGIAAATLALCASLVAISLATGGGAVVISASNAKLGMQIVVDGQGRTLYALRPESTHHLLCKSSACLKFWPPLTVHSSKARLKAGPGVRGRLAILRRADGVLQVTLGGLPLYRYAGDNAKGEANGQNIHSFGGTWHVLSAQGAASPTTPATSTTPAATPTTPATPATPTTPTTPAAPTTPAPATPTTPSPTPGYGY